MKTPFGVSPTQESYVELPGGNVLVFESTEVNSEGTTYVRILDKNGGEIAYWTESEWAESPVEVMGAICGAMRCQDEVTDPEKFYQFAPDCKFPKHIEFIPCTE